LPATTYDSSHERIHVQSVDRTVVVHVRGGVKRAIEQDSDKRIDIETIYFTVAVQITTKHLKRSHVDPGYIVRVPVSDTWAVALIDVGRWHEIRVACVNGRAA
jgi:hypothetical protein